MADIYQNIVFVVREVVNLLVQGKFDSLEGRSKGVRLKAGDMRRAIDEYGRQLIMPPDEAFENLDVMKVDGMRPRRWSVRFDLWTKEEGRSDLSLELTLIEKDNGSLGVEVDDIHVL